MNTEFKTYYEQVHKKEILEGIESSLKRQFDNYLMDIMYNDSKKSTEILDTINHLAKEHKRISWLEERKY